MIQNRPLRIAHVTATFPPHWGGTGNIAYYNAMELARRGHQVSVFTADHAVTREPEPEGVNVHRLRPLFRFGNAPFLPGLWTRRSFDLIHLHYPFYFGAEMVFLRSMLDGSRYVVTYHQDVLFGGLLRYPERWHHRSIGKAILHGAEMVFGTSWDYIQASRLKEILHARPDAVDDLPNGVDAARFRPDIDGGRLRARYGFERSDRVILFVGALDRAHYFKGVDVLLRSVAPLRGTEVRLLVVGDGNLRPAYESMARQLGLEDRVTFAGRVSDAELPAHYAASDLLVLPSTTMGEAFGVVLLEAMASGKPVIASNLPGVRTVVSDGEDGLLVPPGDAPTLTAALRVTLSDPGLRMRMGLAGRSKVEQQYDWPRIGARLERLYFDVLHPEATGGAASAAMGS